MANITASMVKELREMTGAGMMECKKALAEAEGEMEKAVDVLRTRGLAAVAKKAGRAKAIQDGVPRWAPISGRMPWARETQSARISAK